MTRFARSKGSKASNERKEEDPTPWSVMRQQLSEQLLNNSQFSKNDNSLHSLKAIVFNGKNNPKEEVWSEFSEGKVKNGSKVRKQTKTKRENQLDGKVNPMDMSNTHLTLSKTTLNKEDKQLVFSKSKITEVGFEHKNCVENATDVLKPKLKPEKSSACNNNNLINQTLSKKENVVQLKKKMKKRTKRNIQSKLKLNESIEKCLENKSIKQNHFLDLNKKIKSHKNKQKFVGIKSVENANEIHLDDQTSNEEKNHEICSKTNKLNYITSKTNKPFETNQTCKWSKFTESNNKANYEGNKLKKINNFWKTNSNVQTIFANGRKIKIVKYEAFWVKEEDALKLKILKNKLKDQKVPTDKIKDIMKLERRKAEKALAREKTNVCYQCRKFGHKLSDCPDINDSEMSKSGMCFKCGSLEHTHFQCKVSHSQDFRFAVCFVCKEQGHIARQCPLNPQGQYPKGGSCHLCKEITHLQKDCPKVDKEKSSSSITIEKIKSDKLEEISGVDLNKKKTCSPKNNVVKF